MKSKDWKEELKRRWYLWDYNDKLKQYTTCEEEVIDFISTLLEEARKEGREEIEKEYREYRLERGELE